jgi:CcmD family protein
MRRGLKPRPAKAMMKRLLGLVTMAAVVGVVFSTVPGSAQPQQPPDEQQTEFGEFVPFDQLPPSEQLPAAPLLITAYAFAWLVVFFYVWTVWRRLGKVEAEMHVLEKRQSHGGEGAAGINRTSPR